MPFAPVTSDSDNVAITMRLKKIPNMLEKCPYEEGGQAEAHLCICADEYVLVI